MKPGGQSGVVFARSAMPASLIFGLVLPAAGFFPEALKAKHILISSLNQAHAPTPNVRTPAKRAGMIKR
jgi:hypothetical protein